MRQTYLCKDLGVEVGGGCVFEGDLLTRDYSKCSIKLDQFNLRILITRTNNILESQMLCTNFEVAQQIKVHSPEIAQAACANRES